MRQTESCWIEMLLAPAHGPVIQAGNHGLSMPPMALNVAVPESVPLPGLVPMAMVTASVAPVTRLLLASRIPTRTAGLIEAPTGKEERCGAGSDACG